MAKKTTGVSALPDSCGCFGDYGGRYVPEVLIPAVVELEREFRAAWADSAFRNEYRALLAQYAGRPNPLTFAQRLSAAAGGAKIYLKREDLNHTGSHKINNTIGQILLAKRMGKKRVIAETGAGMHGVATATACALFNLQCVVYMGAVDVKRQRQNVFRMQLLGAKVVAVKSGSATLKDALNEALRDWTANVRTTYYCLGSVAGPHPYPLLVRTFQAIIGEETRQQILAAEGRLPGAIIACVGGGSNAIGIFHAFRDDRRVKLIGVEAAGCGLRTGKHAASLGCGKPGILHGSKSYVLMDGDGQIQEAHSISAGLDYPGVGPEHAYLKDKGRATYVSITDAEAVAAYQKLARLEGIIPALESAHAVAYATKIARRFAKSTSLIVCLSGRGDKDMESVESWWRQRHRH